MDLPPKLYHVSSAQLIDDVLKNGLRPRSQRPEDEPQWPYEGHWNLLQDVVFLDSHILSAFNHSAEGYDDPVIVEVDTEGLDASLFGINPEEIEHIMEDEMFMHNHHDPKLAPIVTADPSYQELAGDGYGAKELLPRAAAKTLHALLAAALEHGYSLTCAGAIDPERLRVATQAEADAASEAWEAANTEPEASLTVDEW